MSDPHVELLVAPPVPTSDVFPVWTNLVDNWRAEDAHWLRNRVVQIFPDAATRTTEMTGNTQFGMLSILQAGSTVGGPDFWNGSAWEAIRYPNLNVVSAVGPPATVTMKYQGAGSGIQVASDSTVNIGTLTVPGVSTLGQVTATRVFAGAGTTGSTLDNTGIAVKIGTKTAKLATDGASLTVDSPVNITGGVTASAPSTLNGLTVTPGATLVGALTAAAVTATSLVASGTVQGGPVVMGAVSGVYGQLKHSAGGTAAVGVGSDSTVRVDGTSLTVNPPAHFVGRPYLDFGGSYILTAIAGILAVAGGGTPTQVCPDGTIYISY